MRTPQGKSIFDHKWWIVIMTAVLITALGYGIASLPARYLNPMSYKATDPNQDHAPEVTDPRRDPAKYIQKVLEPEIRKRFNEAVVMLHAGQYEFAIASLHRVIELNPLMPEAYVNMGYALLGLEKHGSAKDFFLGAIELNPNQSNAYYGLAIAYEGLELLPEGMGAMRTYLHLAPDTTQHRVKAQAALWEWGEALKKPRTLDLAGSQDVEGDAGKWANISDDGGSE